MRAAVAVHDVPSPCRASHLPMALLMLNNLLETAPDSKER